MNAYGQIYVADLKQSAKIIRWDENMTGHDDGN